MKNFRIVLAVLLILLIPQILAVELEVEKISQGSTIISEFDNPAVFDFIITNHGENDIFEIYSLVSPLIASEERFEIPEKKQLEIKIYLNEELRKNTGFLSLEYEIQGRKTGIFKDKVLLKVVSLGEALKIVPQPIQPDDLNAKIIVSNVEEVDIENITIEFDSVFFKSEETFSFAPSEIKEITIPLIENKEIKSGVYDLTSTIQTEKKEVKINSGIEYLEKENVLEEKNSEGAIVRKTKIKKTNNGNIDSFAEINVNKDIISRLFTGNSPQPDVTERKGVYTKYIWQANLSPGESLEVEITTNYTIPFLIILGIVLIVVFGKIYFRKVLLLDKKVSLVKTKGGEFALKVQLYLNSKKNIENVQVADILPAMTKLYEKFGKKPDKINEQTRRLLWEVGKMNAGESRIISYIIYSKVNIVGRFELPMASASFSLDGKVMRVCSGRAFFVRGGGE